MDAGGDNHKMQNPSQIQVSLLCYQLPAVCAGVCSWEMLNTFCCRRVWSLVFGLPRPFWGFRGFYVVCSNLFQEDISGGEVGNHPVMSFTHEISAVLLLSCAKEGNSFYLQALSLSCSDRDNWPLGFMGKKRALSGKMLEKLITILNEQIFYCHFFSVPRERDNINCLSEKWWRIMTNGYMGDRMNIQIWKK